MIVTMQKRDYDRVAYKIRAVRDEAIKADAGIGEQIGKAFRNLAVQLADEFLAVNPRFKVNQFLVNVVGGGDEGVLAMQEFERMKEQDDGEA